MSNIIKLQADSILHVPLQKYEKNFTFIVNSQRYETSSFFADILSPRISSYHLIDPTINEFTIDTKTSGNFNLIINLMNFHEEAVNDADFAFICEVFEQLKTEKLYVKDENQNKEITNDNVIDLIKRHLPNRYFFKSQLEKEFGFISSHFIELKEQLLSMIDEGEFHLNEYVIEEIIKRECLQLENEDELLSFINNLYSKNKEYSRFYQYVIFENVEVESMKKFIKIFDVNDLSTLIWSSLIYRLQLPILNDEKAIITRKHEYQKKKFFVELESKEKEFDGILNYLQKNFNIKDEISITYSSINAGDPFDLLKYNESHYFETRNVPNSWICFRFNKHKINPSSYILKSYGSSSNHQPKTWVLEGSKDGQDWRILDEQNNNSSLRGSDKVQLFSISKEKNNKESFEYIRIRQTGPNCLNHDYFELNSIEFYGQLI